MIWLIIYLFSLCWFAFFMAYRARQVSKALIIHYGIAKEIIDDRIKDGEKFSSNDLSKYYYCVWSFNKMIWYFWIWDLRFMVDDVVTFKEIYGDLSGEMRLW
jgi:hypothetical protein